MKEQLPQNINIPENKYLKDNGNESREVKGKIKFKLDDKEYELETSSYDFEYTERIQKETGVLGYKRTIIDGQKILNLLKTHYGESKDYPKPEEILLNKLNQALSNGEFPNRTFNHSIGAYQSGDHEKNFVQDKFFIQKLFDIDLTQKIKLGGRKSSVDSNDPIIMNIFDKNNGEAIGEIDTRSLNEYRDKIKNNEIYLIGYNAFNTSVARFWYFSHPQDKINFGFSLNDNLFEQCIKKVYEVFLKSNFDTKNELIGIEQIIRMIAFCNTEFFEDYKKYFEKSHQLQEHKGESSKKIKKKLELEGQWKSKYDYYPLNIFLEELEPKYVEYINLEKKKLEEERKELEVDEKKLSQKFNDIRKKFLSNIDQDEAILNKKTMIVMHDLSLKNYSGNKDFVNKINNIMDECDNQFGISGYMQHTTYDFLRTSTYNEFALPRGDKSDEIFIPIFINHDEVPQICWGYAKYANFVNKKGFNFFEFKHADHLPKPQNK